MAGELTAEAVIVALRYLVDRAGSGRRWAAANGLSPAYVNAVLRGFRTPGDDICRVLGLTRIANVSYRPSAKFHALMEGRKP